MLRRSSCIIALPAMFVGLWPAQAANTVLTLACQGTTKDTTVEGAKPEPVSMGIVVNFTDRTVQGFGLSAVLPLKVTEVDDVSVTFSGSEPKPTVTKWKHLRQHKSRDRGRGGHLQRFGYENRPEHHVNELRVEVQASIADVLMGRWRGWY